MIPLWEGGAERCSDDTLSVTCRLRERERGFVVSDVMVKGCMVVPGAVAVVIWVDAGDGEDGREGRLSIGRVRRAFMSDCKNLV